ncbi:MAG: hypothetical protein H0W63_03985 [Gemmatimonadaceae bacterium]|nr:hypothetical protein [Gemmatimonadaceae bacterium]
MATKLTKPVTRLVEIRGGERWNVTLTPDGVSFRPYQCRTAFLLPYPAAITRAAWLKADADKAAKGTKRKRRVTRGRL